MLEIPEVGLHLCFWIGGGGGGERGGVGWGGLGGGDNGREGVGFKVCVESGWTDMT